MSAREHLETLKSGSNADKMSLFNILMAKAIDGSISDDEIPIMETLKKELIQPQPQVVQMSAVMTGVGGVLS